MATDVLSAVTGAGTGHSWLGAVTPHNPTHLLIHGGSQGRGHCPRLPVGKLRLSGRNPGEMINQVPHLPHPSVPQGPECPFSLGLRAQGTAGLGLCGWGWRAGPTPLTLRCLPLKQPAGAGRGPACFGLPESKAACPGGPTAGHCPAPPDQAVGGQGPPRLRVLLLEAKLPGGAGSKVQRAGPPVRTGAQHIYFPVGPPSSWDLWG